MHMDKEKILAKAALEAREMAYAPYSKFRVGAALLAQDGTVWQGGNIENAAYSVCNCAERTALFKAISEGHRQFEAIAISGGAEDAEKPLPICAPCGVCRQALAEFCKPDMPVLLVKSEQDWEDTTLGALLPRAFGPESLL